MSGRFDGRVALVTGAAGGIGRATAVALAAEGAAVAAADLDAAGAEATAEAARAAGPAGAVGVALDVRDGASVDAAVGLAEDRFGGLDVAVLAAGGSLAGDAPVDRVDPAVLDATLAVDLRGAALCAGAAAAALRRRGGGAVVLVSSYVALGGRSDHHAYVAAKGGVVALARAMAGTYGPDGIRVNAVAPGVVLSERVRGRVAADGVDLDDLRARHPFAVGEPEDLARVVLFLASDDSRLVTGCTVAADGGLSSH